MPPKLKLARIAVRSSVKPISSSFSVNRAGSQSRTLGAPVFRTASGGIYQPFAWVFWGWHYSMSRDIEIRKPFFQGEMMVFAGSVLSMAVFFVLANRRARKLMENSEDLHGSARWAGEKDVRETGLLEAKSGVYVGGWRRNAASGFRYNAARRA